MMAGCLLLYVLNHSSHLLSDGHLKHADELRATVTLSQSSAPCAIIPRVCLEVELPVWSLQSFYRGAE